MKWTRKKRRIVIAIAAFGTAVGLALILSPIISDICARKVMNSRIDMMSSTYDKYDVSDPAISELWQQAEMYNKELAGIFDGDIREIWSYDKQLSLEGSSEIGYIEIPEISVRMVIYHGAGENSLSAGAGHVEGTSLPIGGESTHAVVTAHSGMAGMQAFDRLGELEVGDEFTISVLGKILTYVVYEVEIVLPDDVSSLGIISGEDRVTLITCTPYGVNDHRLLVHAVRKE